ncbi:MAG: hypothetical protein ACI4OH_03395 [Mitsuokella sp.]|uniref:phosphatase domain-containing putative toxin n=1 Tax=Mitsuokella sp. TaxID=2049034 RepID=UPI003F047102
MPFPTIRLIHQKTVLSFLCLSWLILLLVSPLISAAVPAEPAWRLDAAVSSGEPIHFRRDESLKIAGSGQPTKEVLAHLPELLEVSPDTPVWDIDLRQESHGFLNDAAVSWHGPQNAANRGLSAVDVEKDETARLQKTSGTFVRALPMGRYDEEHIKELFAEEAASWSTERGLAHQAGLGYQRFAATDMEWPTPDVIDEFVDFYRSLPKNHGWLFFHCQAGQGRTTTFMVLYELLAEPDCTPAEAVRRQYELGGADLSQGERWQNIQKFAEYVKENRSSDFQQPWSIWLNQKNSEPRR